MTTIKMEGLSGLSEALEDLKPATAKAALRRAGIDALEPVARAARSMAPRDEEDLIESIDVGTKLTPRQAGLERRITSKVAARVYAGAGALPQAITQEFGTYFHPPQPFMRPAWDAEAKPTLERVEKNMWFEVSLAAERAARKAAKG